MFVIVEGSVRVTKSLGKTAKPGGVFGPGDVVGELSILRGRSRTETAMVLEPTQCLVVDVGMLEMMVAKSPNIASHLIAALAQRLQSAENRADVDHRRSAAARLILGLLNVAQEQGEPMDDGIFCRISIADLARRLGEQPAVADEVLARLRRLKLVAEEPDGLLVLRLGSLREFADFVETRNDASGRVN